MCSTSEIGSLRTEVESLKRQVDDEKAQVQGIWRTNCECLMEHDKVIAAKDAEIEQLKQRLLDRASSDRHEPVETRVVAAHEERLSQPAGLRAHRGKVPPVDPFTDPEIQLENCLPSLQRASAWNVWMEDDHLMQLAGHFRGRTRLEWSPLDEESRR